MNVGLRIPSRVDTEPPERSFDLRRYLNFVWRNWLFIVAVTAFVFLIGVVDLMRATPLYTASTQVLLQQDEKAPGLDTVDSDRYYTDRMWYLENQLAILKSDSLLRRVAIKALLPPSTTESKAASQDQNDPASERAIANGINSLRGALGVSRSGEAQVINIAITWDDPARAAQLANAVADAFVVDKLDARLEAAKRASGWLSDRIVELRRQLGDSEDTVAKFRKEHGLTRSGPTVALNDQQLADLNGKLIAARTDAAEKKARVDFLADLAAGKKTLDSLPDSMLSSNSVMAALRETCRRLATRGRFVGALQQKLSGGGEYRGGEAGYRAEHRR